MIVTRELIACIGMLYTYTHTEKIWHLKWHRSCMQIVCSFRLYSSAAHWFRCLFIVWVRMVYRIRGNKRILRLIKKTKTKQKTQMKRWNWKRTQTDSHIYIFTFQRRFILSYLQTSLQMPSLKCVYLYTYIHIYIYITYKTKTTRITFLAGWMADTKLTILHTHFCFYISKMRRRYTHVNGAKPA